MTTDGGRDPWGGLTLADRYRVIKRIAKGGMGTVYLAEDTRLKREVGIKVPSASIIEDEAGTKRFLREIEGIRAVEHPHVVPILDAGEHEGRPWYALRYMKGGPLSARIPHPATKTDLRWLAQVAAALDHCHEQGLIHRDVKPDNILFDEHGTALVTDFGVARWVDRQDATRLTQTGMMPGSPAYMAPEQALGQDVDGKADQYALAVTVYEALSGALPFPGDNAVQLAVDKKRGEFSALGVRVADVPSAASRTLASALSPNPEDRFPNCFTFANAVADGLRGRTTGIKGATPARRRRGRNAARRRSRRGPWVGVLTVSLFVVAILVLLWDGSGRFGLPGVVPASQDHVSSAGREGASDVPTSVLNLAPPVPPRIEVLAPDLDSWTRGVGTVLVGQVHGREEGSIFVRGTAVPVWAGRFESRLNGLAEGPVEVLIRWVPPADSSDQAVELRHRLFVDRTPPRISVSRAVHARIRPSTIVVELDVQDESVDRVLVNDEPAEPGGGSRFLRRIEVSPAVPAGIFVIRVLATDAAGNESKLEYRASLRPLLGRTGATEPRRPQGWDESRPSAIFIRPGQSVEVSYQHVRDGGELMLISVPWDGPWAGPGAPSPRLIRAPAPGSHGRATIEIQLQEGQHALWMDLDYLHLSGVPMSRPGHFLVVDGTAPVVKGVEIAMKGGKRYVQGVVRDVSPVTIEFDDSVHEDIPATPEGRRFLLPVVGHSPTRIRVTDAVGYSVDADVASGSSSKSRGSEESTSREKK